MSEKRVIVQVPVTDEEKKLLKKLAIDQGLSMGQMLREAAKQYLERNTA